jgi:hypothetical protein
MNAKLNAPLPLLRMHRCRYCGERLPFDFLERFILHALSCPVFPPERRRKWEAHARAFGISVN